jgi:aminomethyltransferase
MRRTPLYDKHLAAGGRIVDFAGWDMPVQYGGILEEHRTVREACGMFDISHMGEFFVSGSAVVPWLDGLLTNRVSKLGLGEAQYSLMLNEQGGVIDDLIVYRTGEEEFLLIVNAAKIDEDFAWLDSHRTEGITLLNSSDDFAAIAVQGPQAPQVFEEVFGRAWDGTRNRVLKLDDCVYVAMTGYTGEIGFEVLAPAVSAATYWDKLSAAGARPCGLGARDTLRLEMCYPLNGSDLSPDRTPLEAGLGFFVDLEKDFLGSAPLRDQKANGLTVRLAAIKVDDKSPPIRSHYPVLADGTQVAETTSGALSPSLGCGIAMAYLPLALAKPGQALEIEVRGRRYKSTVVKKPFYQNKP